MRNRYDASSKWLIETFAAELLQLAGVGPVAGVKPLPGEVVQSRQLPDGLVEVTFPNRAEPVLSDQLNKLDLVYIHLVDHSAMGAPVVPLEIKKLIRHHFKNTLILCGGYDKLRAEIDIEDGLCDLIAFGRPFINNPDLVERLKNNWPLSKDLKMDLFYTADQKGYTDYPPFKLPAAASVLQD